MKDKKEKKEKKAKKEKKHKHKNEKKHKHKEEKPSSSSSSSLSMNRITDDDYFQKNVEFKVYLKLNNLQSFESLSSDEARQLFSRFVSAYNSGNLPSYFYSGDIPAELLSLSTKTNHNWKLKIDADTKAKLSETVDNIFHTNHNVKNDQSHHQQSQYNHSNSHGNSNSNSKEISSKSSQRHVDNKLIEKLIEPKSIGREAVIDKRRSVGDKIHGANREREDNVLGAFDESFLMGDDGTDFQRMKKQKLEHDQRRHDANARRLAELQGKESDKYQTFLQTIGMPSGLSTKIVIQPRE